MPCWIWIFFTFYNTELLFLVNADIPSPKHSLLAKTPVVICIFIVIAAASVAWLIRK